METYISQSKFADLCGVTRQAINEQVKRGLLPVNDKRQIHLAQALKARGGLPAKAAAEPEAAEVETEAPWKSAKSELDELKAAQIRFRMEVEKGQYVLKHEVEQAQLDAGHRVLQLINTAVSWSDELYAAGRDASAAEVRKVLKTKVRQLAERIADQLVAIAGDDAAAE